VARAPAPPSDLQAVRESRVTVSDAWQGATHRIAMPAAIEPFAALRRLVWALQRLRPVSSGRVVYESIGGVSMARIPHQVLFIQGGGEGVHDQWDNKLTDSLGRELGSEFEIRYPRMPDEAHPRYASWRAALNEQFAKLTAGAIVVGHSIGGTILINALAEEPPEFTPAAVFLLAAPFVGEGGWPSDEIGPMAGIGEELPTGTRFYLYQGSDDETVPPAHADLYAQAIPRAVVRRFAERDHQFNNDLSEVASEIRRLAFG
jgi:predicted alpha/beta hydrolase family esterase